MRFLKLCPILLSLASCASLSTTFIPLAASPRPLEPRLTASVQMFSGSLPARPFAEVGLVASRGHASMADSELPKLLEALQERAAEDGCEAVINLHSSGLMSEDGEVPGFEGTCIVYRESPATASPDVTAYQSRCDAGGITSCYTLAKMYEEGEGTPQDSARAAALYQRICSLGDAEGCTHLGGMYEHGVGVLQDRARASDLYKQACKDGMLIACVRGRSM